MELPSFVEHSLYLLALLNPASKVMFLSSYSPRLNWKQNYELSWKSSLAALGILVLLAGTGQFVLSRIFRVELYSLQITGGLIVFVMGWNAVQKGRFLQKSEPGVENNTENNITEISLVPLAAPLIAGPGMIAASITGSAHYGLGATTLALSIAVTINFVLMLFSESINRLLLRLHLLGPLIRVTGLVIAAVAMQMMIAGIKTAFPF